MRLRLVICLLIAASSVSSLLAAKLSSEDRQAADALKCGKYDEAIRIYTKLISRYPKSAAAYYNRGLCYLEKENADKAIADFSEAIRLEPANQKYLCKLATAYTEKGFALKNPTYCDKAIAICDETLQHDPKFVYGYLVRGKAFLYKAEITQTVGLCDKAISDLSTAIKANPGDAVAHFDRGRAYYDKGENDRGLADENEALRLAPKLGPAYNARGMIYTHKSDHDKAIADFTKAIEVDKPIRPMKDVAIHYYNRGTNYLYKEKYDKAVADFDQAILLDPRKSCCCVFSHEKLQSGNRRSKSRLAAGFSEGERLQQCGLVSCHLSPSGFARRQTRSPTRNKACEMTNWKHGDYIDTLAAAYAEAGEFEQAVRREREALQLPDMKPKQDEAKARVLLYQSRTPFREERRDPPKSAPIISRESR